MIIVYFEYDAKLLFFGVTAGKQTTRCSLSHDEVAAELHELQRSEWKTSQIESQPVHVLGVVLRDLVFVEGRWVAADIQDGIMTIVADIDDRSDCYLISYDEPDAVYVADDTEETRDFTDQASSSWSSGP